MDSELVFAEVQQVIGKTGKFPAPIAHLAPARSSRVVARLVLARLLVVSFLYR